MFECRVGSYFKLNTKFNLVHSLTDMESLERLGLEGHLNLTSSTRLDSGMWVNIGVDGVALAFGHKGLLGGSPLAFE